MLPEGAVVIEIFNCGLPLHLEHTAHARLRAAACLLLRALLRAVWLSEVFCFFAAAVLTS